MARRHQEGDGRHRCYARACMSLERAGRSFGVSAAKVSARSKRNRRGHASSLGTLAADLELSGIKCRPEAVAAAAVSLAVMVGLGGAAMLVFSVMFLDTPAQAASLGLTGAGPPLSHRYLASFPSAAARKRASELLKWSADGVSLLVMGVRQDASLPKAIGFAGTGTSVFSSELRRCLWEVVTGTHTSFEEAVHAIGDRWERFGSELKTALNAIVVASMEATEEGKRRSLDRANRAMVAGAKRRIEEYALSLSTPSMLLFGLGILLPIMVGSFMPMLSWDIWSGESLTGQVQTGGHALDTAIVMDVIFPVVAFMVASEAVSRRPFDRPVLKGDDVRVWRAVAGAACAGAACAACTLLVLGLQEHPTLVLLSGTVPASAVLWVAFRRGRAPARTRDDEVQDLLFKIGARMLDGDNFESAICRSAQASEGAGRSFGSSLCLKAFAFGQGLEKAIASEVGDERVNAFEALRVVGRASTKDEAHAGMMAMDIASYLRELSEIESTLKMRLRPTISMMRMTAHVLGPVVLGVTFAIYVSLSSVAGGYGDAGASWAMLLTLGVFLAEMNAVVCYFVWGIEGRADLGGLAGSVGACVLISQIVFVSATAVSS